MNIHYIKCTNPYFTEVKDGIKNFEVRVNDRNYSKGDIVYLMEYDFNNNRFYGRSIKVEITYVLHLSSKVFDSGSKHCVFSFKTIQHINDFLCTKKGQVEWLQDFSNQYK